MANSASQESNFSLKYRKLSDEGTGFDRISQLPDVLIQHILSFLPTKDAMATSILSKRWFWLWTSIPLLELNDSPSCLISQKLRTDFIRFATQALIFNSVLSLNKFCLKLHPIYGPVFVNHWIQAAFSRNIKEIDITIHAMANVPFFKLPCEILTTKTVTILKLSHGLELDVVPGKVSLPSLKVLHLVLIKYTNDESVSRLFDGCPVLEELFVRKFDGDNALTLNISIPTLKKLFLRFATGVSQHKLKINAPILEFLNLEENLPLLYDIENISSLVEANITVSVLGNRHVQLVKTLCNVKFLSINWDWFSLSLQEWCECNTFPVFVNLVQLELNVGFEGWTMLSRLLESSHNLKVLVLSKNANCRGLGVECSWKQPNGVPKCFQSCLRTVNLNGFEGLKCQLRVARYILKNARLLKMMDINTEGISNLSLDSKFHMLKKLSMFPRKSKACQLQFS